jgi:PLP dependent protein
MVTFPPTAHTVTDILHNLERVRLRISAAASRAGRSPNEIRLLPVSKTVSAQRLRAAIAAGCREFGENKAQEAAAKSEELADTGVRWSYIGNLQTNKARLVARFAHEFQALDRIEVAVALDRRLQRLGRQLPVLVQVNTSGEPSKFGLAPDEVEHFLRQVQPIDTLHVRGLMTLAVLSEDERAIRDCFVRLRNLRDQLRENGPDGVVLDELSMGMSADYELAIEEGATVVRVGQAIFGQRPTPHGYYWPER